MIVEQVLKCVSFAISVVWFCHLPYVLSSAQETHAFCESESTITFADSTNTSDKSSGDRTDIVECATVSNLARDRQMELYLASISAAEKSLRLGEVGEARRWLDIAPIENRNWEWYFLRNQLDQAQIHINLDVELPTAIACSNDGTKVAIADTNGGIEVRALPALELIRTIGDHARTVYSIAFDRTGQRLTSVSRDQTARVWDLQTQQEISRITLDNEGVAATTFSPDGRYVATCTWLMEEEPRTVRGVVWIWDAETGEIVHRRLHGEKPLDSIAWSGDGNTIAVGSWDGLVHILDSEGNERDVFRLPDEGIYNAVQAVDLDWSGNVVAAGGKDRTVRVWDVESGELVHTLRDHNGFVNDVAISADGHELISGCEDGVIRSWNLTEPWRPPSVLLGHERAVESVARIGESNQIISIARAPSIRLWNDESRSRALVKIDTEIDGSYTTAFATEGVDVYIATYDGEVAVLNSATKQIERRLLVHPESSCNTLDFDQHGRYLMTCSWDSTARLWSLPDFKEVSILDAGGGVTACVLASDAQKALLLVGNSVQVWRPLDGEKITEIADHESTVHAATFSPDETMFATASQDGSVVLRSSDDFSILHEFSAASTAFTAVAFAPNQSWIAAGDIRGRIFIWDIDSGELERTIELGDRSIRYLVVNKDGNRIFAAAKGLAVCSPEIERPILNFQPTSDSVYHVDINVNDESIAVCTTGGEVVICRTQAAR